MSKYLGRLLLVGIVGIVFGCIKQFLWYEHYTDPPVFQSLPISESRMVLRRLIATISYADVIRFLRGVYPKEEPSTHGIGHLLGEEGYRFYREKSFGLCDTIFNYGCYHGVVDMAIRIRGPEQSLAKELFDACNTHLKDPSPCIHPIGHAATILAKYDAVSAFGVCDSLYPEPKVASSCWNGVMMEYINRSSQTAPTEAYGKSDDPYFPCNTFPKQYEASCVSMHLSYLSNLWGGDFQKIIQYCKTYASEETIRECLEAAGAIIAQTYFSSVEDVLSICHQTGLRAYECLVGATVPFVTSRNIHAAETLCRAVEQSEHQKVCYDRIRQIAAQP